MRISVLSVGTELTTGQIINKNAFWLSKKLMDLGVATQMHLTVPDNDQLILKALKTCAEKSDLIFVTGGLGPTSDDFTRKIVAKWAKKKLVWDEPSWDHVKNRLTSRNYPVQDIQKQQCFFPSGAEILFNDQGTANGFLFKALKKTLIVLPGPPREIEAIWNSHLEKYFEKATSNLDRQITESWDTLGYGESEVARLTMEALGNSKLEIGYRVHLPFVEVKVSYLKSQEKNAQPWLKKLEAKIGDITLFRNGEDGAQILSEMLAGYQRLAIYDGACGSFLLNRLEPFLRTRLSQGSFLFSTVCIKDTFLELSKNTLIMYTQKVEENVVKVGLILNKRQQETEFQSPIRSSLLSERRQQYFAEQALLFWLRQLQDLDGRPKMR